MNTSAGVGNGSTTIQQPRKNSNQNIQVYVRVRPINTRERCMRSAEVIDVVSPREIIARHYLDSKLTKKFTFDRSFGPESRQVELYTTVVAPLIEEVLSGYNCTVFAYGQTGTGKTHTMVGTECAELKSSWEDDSEIGIIPRALCHLFDELRLMEMEFSMRISYLELYNEELCDLLSSDDSTKIRIFDDSTKKGSVIIQGLEEIPVHSKDDVYKLLEKGKERRKTATTLLNAQSSRSHTVFSILVHIRENGIDGEEMLKIGKLNLVDLAGSENVSKAGNEKGIRVRETVNINQSLLTLGRVITALVERTPHIPYRESKLTRLLQESLGGRTKTSIIATISPGHKDIEETLSTLEYAHRAKNIQNKPEVNQKLTKKTVLKEYTEEIDKLKRDLMAARDKNGIYLAAETYSEMTLKMDSQHRELNEKMLLIKALKDELQNKEKLFNEVSLHLIDSTEKFKRSEQHLTQTKGILVKTKKILNNTKQKVAEQKILLQTHVKTEEELTNQATQILEVADVATSDTHELHHTIERRMDVDERINNASEMFSERISDSFQLMDENLSQFQQHHSSFARMLMDEIKKCTEKQNELVENATQKIANVNKLFEQAAEITGDMNKKYTVIINEMSTEHRIAMKSDLDKIIDKQAQLKTHISGTVSELAKHNESQKAAIKAMHNNVLQIIERNTNELKAHAAEMHQNIAPIQQVSKSNTQELVQMQTEIANERAIDAEEQSAIDAFLVLMQALRQKRTECVDTIDTLCERLEKNNQKSMQVLDESAQCVLTFCEKHCAASKADQDGCDALSAAAASCVDMGVNECSKLEDQLVNLCDEGMRQVTALTETEERYFSQVSQLLGENLREGERFHSENAEDFLDACTTAKVALSDDAQELSGHITVLSEHATMLQKHVGDYTNIYGLQMEACVSDVQTFRQNDLKTYCPTGATPSKREFVYPRVLASTSPHNQIIKRIRHENDWSDLDTTTTTTIDEASDEEAEEESTMPDISSTETILNSTPLDAPEMVVPYKSSSLVGANSNHALKLPLHLRGNSLTSKNSPLKTSPPNKSPDPSKANKENIS